MLLACGGTAALLLGTYAFADNMGSPWLLLVMAFALTPALIASGQGFQAQGLEVVEFATKKLPQEAEELRQGAMWMIPGF